MYTASKESFVRTSSYVPKYSQLNSLANFSALSLDLLPIITNSANSEFCIAGIVDFLAILPQYISLFLTGSEVLASIRALRLLRVFRILKLTR